MESLKDKIISWLKTRTIKDIVYLKKNYIFSIFGKHPGISEFDAHKLVLKPEKIISVEFSISHQDRLIIIRAFSKNYDTAFIILDPFDDKVAAEFKNKIVILTIYPLRSSNRN